MKEAVNYIHVNFTLISKPDLAKKEHRTTQATHLEKCVSLWSFDELFNELT
ncbi:hypothetical protein ACU8KH_05435 [Lachancea thermotolerans]